MTTNEKRCAICDKSLHHSSRPGAVCQTCRTSDPSESFWRKVDQTPHQDKCWIWTGYIHQSTRNPVGYGWFHCGDLKVAAHVYSWQIHHDRIKPRDMMIDHKCFNGLCVNPEHLELVTARGNANNRYPLAGIGVYRCGHRYLALICDNGDRHNLGLFDTDVEAVNALVRKRLKLARSVTHK